MVVIVAIFAAVNLCYWLIIFSKFYLMKTDNNAIRKNITDIDDSVVIIAARNEEFNLRKNLRFFLDQKPSGFEIMVINDNSVDGSFEFLDEIALDFPHLRILNNEYSSGKKTALQKGITATEKEFIFLTDADCYPKSDNWLHKMRDAFNNEKIDMVLGYSPYTGKKFLSIFIRFETFMTAIQYFSYTLSGMPYMGVGRNMAFRKNVFTGNQGYNKHLDIQSGNDDLFVMENATSDNVAIQIDPESFIYTEPAKTLKEFLKQKSRHISTSFRYKNKFKFLLALYSLSHIGFYISSFVLLLNFYIGEFFLIYAIRITLVMIIAHRPMLRLKESDLFWMIPVLDFFMSLYYIILAFYYALLPKVSWK